MQRIAEGLRRYGDDTPSNFAEVLDDIGRDEIYAMRDDPVSIDELLEALEDNGGPVKLCTECFAFNLTEYDPEDPGPSVVPPESEMGDILTPEEEEAREINQQLSKFL
ncbi:hypothetical protein RH831_10695 [Halodesulfurarchaeum sp. HSR-GB]|uniref:hypothetical protein n=1 Tax=Halodesulfurarchaeum sp. HSR-GB TaxID=3074077 RepID=UPI0028557FF4|nr:hypothetical protein [Halodesulfurarchaeum sp. HSR-GB]MDR5657645.1 hypothetical protein [Halodesulfurarchaeum sp. HSR-GB]